MPQLDMYVMKEPVEWLGEIDKAKVTSHNLLFVLASAGQGPAILSRGACCC